MKALRDLKDLTIHNWVDRKVLGVLYKFVIFGVGKCLFSPNHPVVELRANLKSVSHDATSSR